MKAQVTFQTVFIMFILSIATFAVAPIIYGAINLDFATMNPFEKLMSVLIIPTILLGIAMIPFDRNTIVNIVLGRRNEPRGRFR